MSASAALAWQNQVYKKINYRLNRMREEFEEIQFLRLEVEGLRDLRKKLLTEKCD